MLSWINFLTRLLNHWFATPLDALLARLGIHPANPAQPINNALTLELIVFTGLILFFMLVRSRLSVEKPGPAQQLAEMTHEFVNNQAEQVMGHGHDPHPVSYTHLDVYKRQPLKTLPYSPITRQRMCSCM